VDWGLYMIRGRDHVSTLGGSGTGSPFWMTSLSGEVEETMYSTTVGAAGGLPRLNGEAIASLAVGKAEAVNTWTAGMAVMSFAVYCGKTSTTPHRRGVPEEPGADSPPSPRLRGVGDVAFGSRREGSSDS
jgi:hypothetical protein